MSAFTEGVHYDHRFVAGRIGEGLHLVAAWRERREEHAERADLTPREVASIEKASLYLTPPGGPA